MKTTVMIALAAGVLACAGERSPTGPTPNKITLSDADVALAQVALDDAQNRLQAALSDRSVGAAVSQALTDATAALAARNADDFRSAMNRAKAALPSSAVGDDAPTVDQLQVAIALTDAFVLGAITNIGD